MAVVFFGTPQLLEEGRWEVPKALSLEPGWVRGVPVSWPVRHDVSAWGHGCEELPTLTL